jgi:uncharacterized protein YhfF
VQADEKTVVVGQLDMKMKSSEWASLETFAFGDNPALSTELSALVLAGTKTATCWAAQEGQETAVGKRMVDYWRAAHRRYFTRRGTFAPDMELWCERFRVVEQLRN